MQEFCYHCGRKLNQGDLVCPECGAVTDLGRDAGMDRQPAKSGGKGPVWLPTAIMIIVLVVGCVLILNMLSQDTPQKQDDLNVQFDWEYEFDNGVSSNYSFTLNVKKADLDAAKNSPIDRNGTTASDRYKHPDGGIVFGVHEYIVVDGYVQTLSLKLKEFYDATKPAGANDELATFISGFVQKNIAYDHEEESSGKEFWRYPLETICGKLGDCEDTAILNAALLDAAEYNAGIFLLPGHAVCAIDKTSVGATYVNERFGFYPIETATDKSIQYAIGVINSKYLGAYFHLYTGHSEEYYH